MRRVCVSVSKVRHKKKHTTTTREQKENKKNRK